MPYRWMVYYLDRYLGRIHSNRDDGPEIALWLARETLGSFDPLDVRVEAVTTGSVRVQRPVSC